jgi:hypothetical protein
MNLVMTFISPKNFIPILNNMKKATEKDLIRILKRFEISCKANRSHEQIPFDLSNFFSWLKNEVSWEIESPKAQKDNQLNEQVTSLFSLFKSVNDKIELWNPIQRNTIKWMLKVCLTKKQKIWLNTLYQFKEDNMHQLF